MRLIVQYLNSFATVASSPDPDVREAFGTHLVDLLMLIVGADRDCLELIQRPRVSRPREPRRY